MSAPYEYPPTPLSITDLLAWAGATGGGLVDYPADEELRHDWKWKFDKWQRATVAMRDMLVNGTYSIPIVLPAGGGSIPAGTASIIGWDDSLKAWKIATANNTTGALAHVLVLATLAEAVVGRGYLIGDFTSGLNTSGAAVNDPVYQGGGILTLSRPTTGTVHRVGYVKTLHASAGVVSGKLYAAEYATEDLLVEVQAIEALVTPGLVLSDVSEPPNPASGASVTYMKGGKYIIKYNDESVMYYNYLDLVSGAGVWVNNGTTPP